jgi:hypothetical protein
MNPLGCISWIPNIDIEIVPSLEYFLGQNMHLLLCIESCTTLYDFSVIFLTVRSSMRKDSQYRAV